MSLPLAAMHIWWPAVELTSRWKLTARLNRTDYAEEQWKSESASSAVVLMQTFLHWQLRSCVSGDLGWLGKNLSIIHRRASLDAEWKKDSAFVAFSVFEKSKFRC